MYEQLKLDNQLCFRIYVAQRLITQAYRPFLEPLGLTYPQYLVMLILWERDNCFVGDIGKRLGLDSNTLTPLLQRMEKEGLLIRTKGVADARQTLISLSKKGQHLEEKAKDVPACMATYWDGAEMNVDNLKIMVEQIDLIIDKLRKQ